MILRKRFFGLPSTITYPRLVFTLLLVFPCGLSAQALKPIEIAIGEWQPFVTEYQDGFGEITEVVTVILERMGYRPEYTFMPWGRAETVVGRNGSDTGPRATFPFIRTSRREQIFLFSSKPIWASCIRFFYNQNKVPGSAAISIATVNDVADFRIGYVSQGGGYQYPPDLARILENGQNTEYGSLYEAFGELVDPEKPVQVVPSVAEVGEELLYELFPEQRFGIAVMEETAPQNSGDCLVPTQYYFLTSKRNPNNAEFIRQFDREHARIEQETGETLARIRRKAAERPTARTPEIVLDKGDSPESIKGRDETGEIYLLPRGTHGLLLDWNPGPGANEITAKVRIISGPYRGKVLQVEGKYIKLI